MTVARFDPIIDLAYHYERVMARSRFDGRCRVWTGGCNSHGRGTTRVGSRKDNTRRTVQVHRLVWEFHNGPAPEGMYVLHSCDRGHEACMDEAHLYLGTQYENMQDREERGAERARGADGRYMVMT